MKVTLNDVANLQNETSAVNTINSNSAVIETAFDNTLSRNGTLPNQMSAVLDMNSNQIINLPAPSTVNSPARLIDVVSNPTIVIPGTGTSGHFVPFLDGNNTWSGTNTFSGSITGNTTSSGTFSATKYLISNDLILTHPLNPSSSVGLPGTNITLGLLAGAAIAVIPTTNYLTLVGYGAGRNITTADHITALGAFALENYTVSTASPGNQPSLTAIGIDSMRAFTTGQGNTALGEHTMTANTTISDSVAVGNGAMFNSGGVRNTAIGVSAMLGAFPAINYLSGNDNTAIGSNSLVAIGTTSSTNTAIGSYSLAGASLTQGNTAVGYFAGLSITTGSFNILIGQAAGSVTLATGGQNILIGLGADTPTASTSNYLNIGGWLYGDAANVVNVKGSLATKVPTVLTGTSGTVGNDDSSIVVFSSGAFTITLPSPVTYPGRWLDIKTISNQTVSSASANVAPLVGGVNGTAILAATAGKWARLQSDGSEWQIMAGN